MSGRSRHCLNVAQENLAPVDEPILAPLRSVHRPLSPGLIRKSAALCIAGSLHAGTAGRLQMFLPMFTADGGPRELLPDLSDVFAVDEDAMAPIVEADEAMCARKASIRPSSMTAAVARHLVDLRLDGMLATGQPPEPDAVPEAPVGDSDGPRLEAV